MPDRSLEPIDLDAARLQVALVLPQIVGPLNAPRDVAECRLRRACEQERMMVEVLPRAQVDLVVRLLGDEETERLREKIPRGLEVADPQLRVSDVGDCHAASSASV